jgi:hypothetical protein
MVLNWRYESKLKSVKLGRLHKSLNWDYLNWNIEEIHPEILGMLIVIQVCRFDSLWIALIVKTFGLVL